MYWTEKDKKEILLFWVIRRIGPSHLVVLFKRLHLRGRNSEKVKRVSYSAYLFNVAYVEPASLGVSTWTRGCTFLIRSSFFPNSLYCYSNGNTPSFSILWNNLFFNDLVTFNSDHALSLKNKNKDNYYFFSINSWYRSTYVFYTSFWFNFSRSSVPRNVSFFSLDFAIC